MHIHIRHIESRRDFRLTDFESLRDAKSPAWSPGGDRIVLVNHGSIFISSVDPFNPEVFQITHDQGSTAPTWSPDGKQIAFSSHLDGNWNIFAIDVDGRNRIRLTNDAADDERPDWSPDGSQIAFMSRHHGVWDFFVVDTETFVETKLTDSRGGYIEPSWSPDGSKIAMGEGDIYVINADGTGLTNITNPPEYESSPDWH